MQQTNQHFYLGLDYGKKRIGLAYASHPLYITVPIGILETKHTLKDTAEEVNQVIYERKITDVVIGNPISMKNHSPSLMQGEIKLFIAELQTISKVSIHLWDERLSSMQAERMLKEDCGLKRKQRKQKTDSIAATLILSSFLECHSSS